MGKNIINIALFGLGRIGQMHANNLINHKDFNLKYIFDKNQKLTKKLSKKYNSIDIQNPKIAFKDKNIKCIFIASSTNTHLKFIEEAVVNKKVVFCEKPLDLDLNKINKCKKRISKYKPKIQLGFNRRYDPAHNSLNRNLLKGKIGKLEKIIITSFFFILIACIAKYKADVPLLHDAAYLTFKYLLTLFSKLSTSLPVVIF